jgi:DNA primase
MEFDRSFLDAIDLVSLIEQEAPTRFGRPYGTGEKRTVKGACPWCGGTDRFAVFIADTPQRFKCGIHGNGCGRHGDAITFLREHKGLGFQQAIAFLQGEKVDLSRRRDNYERPGLAYMDKRWQERVARFCKQAELDLSEDSELQVMSYLWQRGLEDETIKAAHLGAAVFNGKTCLVIPWYDVKKGLYTRVTLRDIYATDPKKRYTQLAGGSNEALYGAVDLNRPIILVEGELDALTIAQQLGDLAAEIAVIATGSTGANRTAKPMMRLSAAPHVFVAFDSEERGEQGAVYWMQHLPNVTRWRTPIGKDANESYMSGVDLQAWAQAALYTLTEEVKPVEIANSKPFTPQDARALVESIFGKCEMKVYRRGELTHDMRIAQLGLKVKSLDVPCAICRYNEAVVLWIEAKPYCQSCQDAEKARLAAAV